MINKRVTNEYISISREVFRIPDLTKGFIPQGIAYDSNTDFFFVTGYMDNGRKSPIFVIDRKTGRTIKTIRMLMDDGRKFKGHAGGLSVYMDRLFIAGSTDACMYSFLITDILSGQDEADVPAFQRISLKNKSDFMRASFTAVDDSLVYSGEFHKGFIFYTHKSHKVACGKTQQNAYLMGFSMDEYGKAQPVKVYSIPDNIQGACFYKEYVFLSQSHGLLPGCIMAYSLNKINQEGTRHVLDKEIPFYVLTSDNADKITEIPPMCEEIIVVDDEMLVVFEAAANRYLIGKSLGLDKVYATPVTHFIDAEN